MDIHCLKFFQRLSDKCITWKFVALVHDEIIFRIREDQVEEARAIQDQCVEELNRNLGWPIPMRLGWVEAKTFAEIK
jgi:DNA polymerase I-like protein with 3'-5' exonuclease and polymerase domains